MQTSIQLVQATYDRLAARYDDRWSRHMRQPQDRLTQELGLSSGARWADLGCGTAIETLEMSKRVAPGEVVGVDCSEEMLRAATARAAAQGLPLTTVCAGVEEFIRSAEDASFDGITLRFCLAYLDWRAALPCLGRLLRPGGRVGVLTNLVTSTPQAYAVYRRMVDEFDLPNVALPVPDTNDPICAHLEGGGLRTQASWEHRFRIWFDSGAEVAGWLQESGFVTHAALRELPPAMLQALIEVFASRLEDYREPEGIPLDFDLGGVIAVRA